VRDVPFFEQSGGGVTLSGGEALSQFQFTLEILKRLKKAGIHTALDTTGFAPAEQVRAVIPSTDLFLYDLKHMDSHAHKRMIGVPNELIISNARLIAEQGGKMQIRLPIILNSTIRRKMWRRQQPSAGAGGCRNARPAAAVSQFGLSEISASGRRGNRCAGRAALREKSRRHQGDFGKYGFEVSVH
jgi:hypothetical protein